MANPPQVDIPEPELIHQQMEETRSSLADKLDILEQKVTDTVQDAKAAVSHTVEVVKESVESTVDSVKETLNLRLQVERHPWTMVGASAAVGFLGGWLLPPSPRHRRGPMGQGMPEVPRQVEPAASTRQPSWFDRALQSLAPNVERLKSLAIGTVAGIVRDQLVENVSDNLKPHLTERINDLTTSLGGDVIPGPVLGDATEPDVGAIGH